MSDKKVSIMSFNIMNGWGNNSDYAPPAFREKWVARIVNEQNPDLIGFQETSDCCIVWENELNKDLCENGAYDYRALSQEEDFKLKKMTTGAGLIIMWKKDRFELKDSGCFEYTPFSRQVRYYQWVKLYDKVYDKNIVMTNTHLSIDSDSKPKGEEFTAADGHAVRNIQAGELFGFWKENVTGDAALFATGDYNSLLTEMDHTTFQQDGLFMPSCNIAEVYDEKSLIDFCYTSPATVGVDEVKTLAYLFRDDIKIQDLPDTFYRASDHNPVMTWAYYK